MSAGRMRISSQAWEALDAFRFSTSSKIEFRNATLVLMSHYSLGHTKTSIARELGCSISTIDLIRARYRKEGIDGLREKSRPGRVPRVTAAYRKALRQTVQTLPASLGYGFTVWSIPRLNAHLKKITTLSFSDGHLTRLLHEEGFSLQRPKHTTKGKRDEEAYQKAATRLERLKKRPSGAMPTSS
jgi:putative transposase